jgi:hypothetical protein
MKAKEKERHNSKDKDKDKQRREARKDILPFAQPWRRVQ